MFRVPPSMFIGLLLLCVGSGGFALSLRLTTMASPLTASWQGHAWIVALPVALAGAVISVTAWRNR